MGKVNLLEEENRDLRIKIYEQDRVSYILLHDEIISFILDGDELTSRYSLMINNIEENSVLIALNAVNNPNSDVLGFNFMSIVLDAVNVELLADLEPEERPRFIDIVKKIVKNPVVDVLLSINPVTSVVDKIVSKASSFFQSSGLLGKSKKVKVEIDYFVDEKKLGKFMDKLNPYIKFYNKLILARDKYDREIINLDEIIKNAEVSVSTLYERLNNILENDSKSSKKLLEKIRIICPSPQNVELENFSDLLKEPLLNEVFQLAKEFNKSVSFVSNVERLYHKILMSYLEENLNIIKSTNTFSNKDFDQAKLNNLKEEIEILITSINGK